MPPVWKEFGVPNIARFGENALVLETGAVASLEVQRALGRAAEALRMAPGAVDAVAGIGNLTLFYDPLQVDTANARDQLARAWHDAQTGASDVEVAPIEIPVRYGGDAAPDLEAVALRSGLSVEEYIARHVAGDYAVYVMGFAPGFAYVGGLDPALQVARRAHPRARVPAGSVAVADAFTGVYPRESPGGWNVIGRTELALFDPLRSPASLLSPGVRVRFVRI